MVLTKFQGEPIKLDKMNYLEWNQEEVDKTELLDLNELLLKILKLC